MNNQIETGNTWGRGLFLGGQPRPPFQGGTALADPDFAGSLLLMGARLDPEQPKPVWYHIWGGGVLGQQRRYICKNVSHGFSAAVEFLVNACFSNVSR